MSERGRLELVFTPGRDALIAYGPCIPLRLRDSVGGWVDCIGQIDTGADYSAISPTLFAKLGLPVARKILWQAAGHDPAMVDTCAGAILFQQGAEVQCDLGVLTTLDDGCDVLIGRDLLARGSLAIDFIKGVFMLKLDLSQ